MLHVFIREPLAAWTLRQSDAFPKRAVVRFAVRCVECFDGVAAGYADWHWSGSGSRRECGGEECVDVEWGGGLWESVESGA